MNFLRFHYVLLIAFVICHKTRAVLLNNWEATGFDFDFNRIASLYEPAKELGVALFLLDDGWFGNKYPRVNDHAGLDDWQLGRAAVFVFQLRAGPGSPVRPQELDPAKSYTVHELNPAPDRAPMPQEGKSFTGGELMHDGIVPSRKNALEASVVELSP